MVDALRSAQRTWSDAQLADAVHVSTNWRGVMRVLGLPSTSAGATRVVRRHATRLGLDTSHFRGKRRWSDEQLRDAVAAALSWTEVVARLGLSTRSANVEPHIKGHAIRLGLDTSHLSRPSHARRDPAEPRARVSDLNASLKYLRVAAPAAAATWFALRGCAVSLPVEPTQYDLLVDTPDGIRSVQVKTTTSATKNGWVAGVGHHPDTHARKGHVVAYDPEVIDLFFIIDGDMTMYLIPSRAIAGRVSILLRTYKKYIVGNVSGLLGAAAASGQPAPAVACGGKKYAGGIR